MNLAEKVTSYYCFAKNPLISGGIGTVREQFTDQIVKDALKIYPNEKIKIDHCKQMEIYIFGWGTEHENGMLVGNWGHKNEFIQAANNGSLKTILDREDCQKAKELLPQIDKRAQEDITKAKKEYQKAIDRLNYKIGQNVNSHREASSVKMIQERDELVKLNEALNPAFKLIPDEDIVDSVAAKFNYVYYFVMLEIQPKAGPREVHIYPKNNPKYQEWVKLAIDIRNEAKANPGKTYSEPPPFLKWIQTEMELEPVEDFGN